MKFKPTSFLHSLVIVYLFTMVSSISIAQNIKLSSGVGYMSFVDFFEDSDYYKAEYESGGHQFVKLDFSNFFSNSSFLNFYVNLEKSKGVVNSVGYNGLYCGIGRPPNHTSVNSDFTFYRVGVGIIPLKCNIYRGLQLSAGLEFSKVIRSEYTTYQNLNFRTQGRIRSPQDSEKLIKSYSVGLSTELQFGQFSLSDKIFIAPVYNASFGFLEEIETGYNTRSIRQSLGFALTWDSF